MLRHAYVTTMLDADVSLRDVQVAARHADPGTTMRYYRARNRKPTPLDPTGTCAHRPTVLDMRVIFVDISAGHVGLSSSEMEAGAQASSSGQVSTQE